MGQIKFNIEVLSVSQPTYTKTAKGGYNQIEVAFKKDGKVDGKKLIDFKFPEVYKAVVAMKQGDKATVTSEKNDGDKYWTWILVSPLTGSAGTTEENKGADKQPEQPAVDHAGVDKRDQAAPAARGRVTGSNYETPAERARRQVYIVRQSSITAAIELLKLQMSAGETTANFDVDPVVEIARKFEAYVFEKEAKPLPMSDMEDDIPF